MYIYMFKLTGADLHDHNALQEEAEGPHPQNLNPSKLPNVQLLSRFSSWEAGRIEPTASDWIVTEYEDILDRRLKPHSARQTAGSTSIQAAGIQSENASQHTTAVVSSESRISLFQRDIKQTSRKRTSIETGPKESSSLAEIQSQR